MYIFIETASSSVKYVLISKGERSQLGRYKNSFNGNRSRPGVVSRTDESKMSHSWVIMPAQKKVLSASRLCQYHP